MADDGALAYRSPDAANAYGPASSYQLRDPIALPPRQPDDDPETYGNVYRDMSRAGGVPQSDLNAMAIEDGMRRSKARR